MKIAFLSNCLEPGKDGVGDYTRLLARECSKRQHSCLLIALNDSFVNSAREETEDGVKIVRFGQNVAWARRFAEATKILAAFAPDWFSLQFVCYGYDHKGINPSLARRLKTLVGSVPLQIMFHELWIGTELGATVKHRLIGSVQKHFVIRMIGMLRPKIVQTSIPAYLHLLRKNGVIASQLSLFGNVPIQSRRGDLWIYPALQRNGIQISEGNRDNYWLFGIFGTLHSIWPPEPLFGYLRNAALRAKKRIVLISIGRLGAGKELWDSIARKYANEFHFCCLRERSPQELSEFFNTIDYGIATTPYAIINKSGAVAAMVEHGVPVVVNRDDIRFRDFETNVSDGSPLLLKMGDDFLKRFSTACRIDPKSLLPEVAKRFVDEMGSVTTSPKAI
jgi:hypothetical protein